MYLVHIHLRPLRSGDLLPRETAAALVASASGVAVLEHVVVHSERHSRPVIGVFVHAATLEAAEAAAEDIWWQACDRLLRLRRWTMLRAEVPLLCAEDEWPK